MWNHPYVPGIGPMVSVHVCVCFNVVADVVAYVTLSFFVAVREIRLYFFFFCAVFICFRCQYYIYFMKRNGLFFPPFPML